MPNSCRCILKKLVRDGRITQDEYDKLLRNLKDVPQGEWVEVHLSHALYGGDAVIYRCSICGWAVAHKVPKCKCGAVMKNAEEGADDEP